MSQENVEVVRKGFDDFNAFMRGELTREALAESLDSQHEWHWHDDRMMPDAPQHLRGAQKAIEYWAQYRIAWVDLTTEPLEFIEAPDDRVLTLTRQSGRGRDSGLPIEIHYFNVFSIRDGKVWKVELFRHRAEALEAAGLSE
ncbi:MAG: nuclear transport factor 2 family protein [Actinomycetota bacterium]